MVFFLNIFSLVLSYAIIFLCYLMLARDKETFVKILLIMGECSAIFFCFCSQNELSRFQAVFSFFLSDFSNIIILEKLSEHIFFDLFLFFFDKKEDEFFQTLGRKQTTFLSRLVIYGGAVFFFLLYPAAAFILLKNPFFVKNLYKGSKRLWQIMFTKKWPEILSWSIWDCSF